MGDWVERNKAHIIVLLLSLISNGVLLLILNRPPSHEIKIVPPTATTAQTAVRVFVSGAVATPDVYQVPVGSLVRDAILAAGGYTAEADLNQINLARQVRDQEQVFVPFRSTGQRVPGESLWPIGPVGGKINLNTATLAELESLPGIGPGLAKSILEYRAINGSFASVEEIKDIPGVGEKTYERLKDLITVN